MSVTFRNNNMVYCIRYMRAWHTTRTCYD